MYDPGLDPGPEKKISVTIREIWIISVYLLIVWLTKFSIVDDCTIILHCEHLETGWRIYENLFLVLGDFFLHHFL